jgi:hypothetical protein
MLRLVHPTPTTDTDDETPIDIRPPVDHEARIRAEQERENATRAAVAALRPAWAEALIVAECEHDACDSQSDYFNTKTSRIVALAWSRHTRDLFPELRKAAARFEETRHLGPGCSLVTANVILLDDVVSGGSGYWKGSALALASGAVRRQFAVSRRRGPVHHPRPGRGVHPQPANPSRSCSTATRPTKRPCASVGRSTTHRSSIGKSTRWDTATILKGSTRYSDGWMVRKVSPGNVAGRMELDLLR